MNDIGELADAGRLDDDAVRVVFLRHFLQRLTEITDQRAADAAAVHFPDLNAGVLQKAAVDADLAEFILDENDLLSLQRVPEQLLDQRCLAGSEKAGNNIYLYHAYSFQCYFPPAAGLRPFHMYFT